MIDRRSLLQSAGIGLMAAAATRRSNAAANAPRIKIGQIGVGHAHASKLSVYRQSPDYEVVGIAESNAELRRQAESQPVYQGLHWMTEEQLLNVPGLEAVMVETEVRHLLDTAQRCIGAGKHIHLDKPAGESLPQFRQILESAAKQQLLIQLGYMYRYSPAIVLLRKALRDGWLGDVFEVHAVMSKVLDPKTRVELAAYRGGMMFELGCHVIDLVVGILGKPEKVTPVYQHASTQADMLLDNMLAVLHYPNAIATVKSSAMEVEGFARRHLAVCGTAGTFHVQPLDNPAIRLALLQPRDSYQSGYQDIPLPTYTRYVDDAADMAKVIRHQKPSDFSYEHDAAVQETVLRASGVLV